MGRSEDFRGNRSRGRGQGKPSNQKKKEKKTVIDYEFQLNNSGEYESTKEFIVNHTKQECEHGCDIGTALSDRVEFDFTAEMPEWNSQC